MSGKLRAHAQGAKPQKFDRMPKLERMLDDAATCQAYAQDYGQIIHEPPRAVLKPESVAEIVEAVHFARRSGLRIAARGHGHQPYGQAQVRDGLVIDLRSRQRIHAVTPERIEVDAGADWRMIVQTAVAQGHTAPVLPAFLGLTAGGTLSIGGIGPTTWRCGAQIDQVLELEVVTGEGTVVTCSKARSRDLFEAVLAGQGQCAIITRAALRSVAAPSMVREYLLRYLDLSTMLADQRMLVDQGRFDGVVALLMPSENGWQFALSGTRHFTPPQKPDDAAYAGLRLSEVRRSASGGSVSATARGPRADRPRSGGASIHRRHAAAPQCRRPWHGDASARVRLESTGVHSAAISSPERAALRVCGDVARDE
jgi:cytokinin dehydrogenase